MKPQQAVSWFLKESGMLLAAGAVVGGLVFGLSVWGDNISREVQTMQGDVTRIANETTKIQTNFAKVLRYKDLYRDILKTEKEVGLSIDRQTLARTFNGFNDLYHLSGLRLTMAGIEALGDPKYQRQTHIIESGKVALSVNAPADPYIYDFVSAIQKDLSGSARITNFSITRRILLTNEILKILTDQGTYGLVEANFQFDWLGIRQLDSKDGTTSEESRKQ